MHKIDNYYIKKYYDNNFKHCDYNYKYIYNDNNYKYDDTISKLLNFLKSCEKKNKCFSDKSTQTDKFTQTYDEPTQTDKFTQNKQTENEQTSTTNRTLPVNLLESEKFYSNMINELMNLKPFDKNNCFTQNKQNDNEQTSTTNQTLPNNYSDLEKKYYESCFSNSESKTKSAEDIEFKMNFLQKKKENNSTYDYSSDELYNFVEFNNSNAKTDNTKLIFELKDKYEKVKKEYYDNCEKMDKILDDTTEQEQLLKREYLDLKNLIENSCDFDDDTNNDIII